MPETIVPRFTPSARLVGTHTGMISTALEIRMLIGSPIAGALIEYGSGDFHCQRTQLFVGLFITISAVFFVYPVSYIQQKNPEA